MVQKEINKFYSKFIGIMQYETYLLRQIYRLTLFIIEMHVTCASRLYKVVSM